MSEPADVRWYRHRWNTDLSWRLILRIIPRVPPFLRPPIHLVTTAICFAAMGEERRASRRNLRRVTGKKGLALFFLSFRLFYDFSKFMVVYTEAPPYGQGVPRGRVRGGAEADRIIETILAEGRGLIVLNMHLGQWDLALIDLARKGIPISVVMRREDEESARYAAAARRAAGISVIHPGSSAWTSVQLLAALRRNEIVAIQGDRNYGGKSTIVSLFGGRAAVPAGPWDLARAAGAPVLPAAMIIEGHRRFRHVFGDPIRPHAPAGTGAGDDGGHARLASAMEEMIRRYPSQWFNFYDVWATGGAAVAGAADPAPLARALSGAAAGSDPERAR